PSCRVIRFQSTADSCSDAAGWSTSEGVRDCVDDICPLPNFCGASISHHDSDRVKTLTQRAVALQLVVFVTQWALMILGFGILALLVAPLRIQLELSLGRYFEAAVKAIVALVLSISWLFIWDRQVRLYFYRRREGAAEPI